MNRFLLYISNVKFFSYPLLAVLIAALFTFCNGTSNNNNTDNKAESNSLLSTPAEHTTDDKADIAADKSNNTSARISNTKFVTDQMDNATAIQATVVGNPRKLPVYGFNGNITQSPSFANKAFRDSVASLGLKIIRYPGGSVSNFWDWKKGWFEGAANIEGVNNPRAAQRIRQAADYGLNQLKLLVDEANCDVVFTLNIVTKSLDDQIEMLKSAQSLGIPVKWIELGNEFNLKKNPGKQKFVTAENYGKVCSKWIDGLKKAFPNAEIAVVGGNRDYSSDVKNWNSTVLRNAPNADAIVAHYYASPDRVVDKSGINFEMLYNSFSHGYIGEGFQNIAKDKKIWVTEYNILWALAKDKSLTSNVGTWGQVLAAILMTSTLTDWSDQVQLVLNHNIANSSAFAAIETKDGTFKKMPNGIGMQKWFAAVNQMTDLQKIRFSENGNAQKDYELLGWKFSNSQGKISLLVCNFTADANTVSLSNLLGPNTASYTTVFAADKQANLNEVKRNTGSLSNNSTLEVRPYSVTIISNQ